MSFTDEYLALKKKKKEQVLSQKKTGHSFTDEYLAAKSSEPNVMDIAPTFTNKTATLYQPDLAPVMPTVTKEDDRKWFQKGAFEDGYQFGDVMKTILGTTTDVAEDFNTGILGMGEQVLDALVYGSPTMVQGELLMGGLPAAETQKIVEESRQWANDFIKKDLYDENEIAKKILSNVASSAYLKSVTEGGGLATQADLEIAKQMSDTSRAYIDNQMEGASVLGDKADSVVQSFGQYAATRAVSPIIPWQVVTALTSAGSEVESALNEGASYDEAGVSAVVSAGGEVLSEYLTGGMFGEMGLDDALIKRLSRTFSNKLLRGSAAVSLKGLGEGLEELFSLAVGRFGKWLTYQDDKTLKELFFSEEALEEASDTFWSGFALGGINNTAAAIKSNASGVDFASGMTENEDKVVKKVYDDRVAEEQKKGKVTQKQKDKIYNEVLQDMERGRISTDTIEEVLGGETYKSYKNTVDSEDTLRKEYDELGKKKDPTLAEQTRYKELHEQVKGLDTTSQRNALKEQLGSEVMSLVQSDRLAESYNERSRRGQAYQADVSKYDAKQQATIQKAIDSGILNNTNRTHEFVDMIAKITADKGVVFDFTNNERLKGSVFAVDGKTVNGYVTKDGVTLNIDSAKSLNSVVGHEIAHVLEGTELYDALQTAVTDYAKTKGEYDKRLESLTKLYEGVKDADVNAELVADLVGDYLFTDTDFVRNLSTGNRNVFQKIYDEIKYLCKVATAGSKEARELEKVKKVFEDAYRATRSTEAMTEKTETQKAPVNEAYGAVENILGMDRINNTLANEIIHNAEVSQAFTDITGVELTGTTEQKRQLIRDTVREWQDRSAENEALAMEAGELTTAEFEKLEAEQAVRDSGYRSYIIGMFANGATVAEAQEIIRNPELRAEWEAVTGKKLPDNYKSAIKMIRQTQRNPQKLNEGFAKQYLDTKKVQYNLSAVETHQKNLELKYSKDAAIDLDTVMGRYAKILEIWDRIGGELDSKFLNDWNSKVKKDRAFTVFKAQTGYKYNVELSSMCKKGVPLFEAIDTIVKQEVMKDLQTDVLGKAEKEILYDILKQHSFEIPCAICYVEQARQREGNVINAFLNGRVDTDANGNTTNIKLGWNQMLDSIEEEMRANGVDYTFPGVSRDIATDKYMPEDISMDEATQDAFYEAAMKVLNNEILRYNKANKKNRKLLTDISPKSIKENLKGTLPDNLKIFKVLLTEPSSRFRIQSDLLYSSLTTQNLSLAHNALYTVFNAQGGVSGYKTKQGTAIYWGDILGKKWTSSATRKEGGIRNQSNSDFQMYTLLDQAQMYMDFTAKGYYLQAYTKVLSELKLFGMSNGKINASLIPRVIEYKNADGTVDIERTMQNAGLNENGEPIYDDIEGINHAEAFMLIDDAEYSKSICGICIGYSDNHIRKLLDDKRVQLIIGYHDNTNDPNKRYRGARYATNYTGRNEATSKKTGETVHMNFNPYVVKAEKMFKRNGETFIGEAEFNGKTYVADDIPKLAADMYLADCEAKGLNPAYMGFETHPNYYKLLADFGLYDSQGHYAPHRKVAYNMPDTVPYLDEYGSKRYMPTDEYIKKELQKELRVRDSIAEALADTSPEGIIPQFKQRVNELHNMAPTAGPDVSYSMSEEGEQYAPVNSREVFGRDIALEAAPVEDAAPVAEGTVANNARVPQDDIAPTGGQERTEGGKPAPRKDLHRGIVNNIKSKFSEKGLDFDEVLKEAKNLSTFATVDNSPQRVMEKALGYKEGQLLSDLTVNKVAQNETEGIKWLNSFTDRKSGLLKKLSDRYHIKPGSKESAAAQMYAEGFYVAENNDIVAYGDAELAKDFPNIRVQQNIKGLANDPTIRRIYDETLEAINESRTRNAYPAIQKLENYFLHFRAMDDTFSKLGLPFNPNDIRAKDLPTDLNGVTADLKPGQPYFASAMHRTGKRTSFDLLGGLEKYLSSAKNQIYHIDDIQTLRALRNYIADTYGQANGLEGLDALSEEEAQDRIEQVYNSHLSTFAKFLNEEANILAGKTALIDRGLEGVIGRRGITFLNTVNGQVGSNMVGFNISSSLTNFLPVAQTFAKTNKFDFTKAFAQTVANKLSGGRFDSFAEKSPVVIRRKGSDRFYRTPWQKAGDAGYVLMSAVDDISTELIARTKYNELTRKGMDEQKAHFETDKWVSRLMGDRSIGQMPQLYNSKMLGLVTKFQLEVRNQLDSQFYDTIQDAKVSTEHIENKLAKNAKVAAKVASTFTQLAVVQHLFGKAFESVAGYNPAFDIIEVLLTAFGFDDDEDSEDTVLDNVEQAFLGLLEDIPYTSTLTGGRIPISSALPVTELIKGQDEWGNEKSRWETLGEIAPYYLMPGGYGQIKKTAKGLDMFSDEHPIAGSYTDSGNLRFPVEDTLGSRVQAGIFGQWATDAAGEYIDRSRTPMKGKDIQEFNALDISIEDYWDYQDEAKKIAKRAEIEGAKDEDILKSKYLNSVNSELSELYSEMQEIMEDASLSDEAKQMRIKPIQKRFDELSKESYGSYNKVSIDGDFAHIGDRYYQWYTPEKGEPEWRKLTDDQVTKYLTTRNAKGHYATNGSVHYRLEEGGNPKNFSDWTKISDKELARQKEVTSNLGITPEEYWSKTEKSVFPMYEGEYEYAFENPENYAVAKAVGGYDAFRGYSTDLNNIKADKDASGKSISGSRKEKVLDYINNLDADYYTKIILWKGEYTSDDSYNNEIIDYLNSREDISFDEMVSILRKLGFDVTDDGDISW